MIDNGPANGITWDVAAKDGSILHVPYFPPIRPRSINANSPIQKESAECIYIGSKGKWHHRLTSISTFVAVSLLDWALTGTVIQLPVLENE